MVFLAIVILGVIGWWRIPVELMPALGGDSLHVSFFRPGSEPEAVERELLTPLESRVWELAGLDQTWGEVRGSGGSLQVRFSPGADMKIRELELQRLAADLARGQPVGTVVEVSAENLEVASRFVMIVNVAGGEDRYAIRDLVEELVEPRLSAVSGVSRVLAGGGASRELTVRVDPDRCAALGVTPPAIVGALQRSVQRLRHLGGCEDEAGRTAVVLDGRPSGQITLGEVRIAPEQPVLLRHVASIELGSGREETLFRVDGRPSVGLVIFQDEDANLVALGKRLRRQIRDLGTELEPMGVSLVVSFDAAELVEEQLDRLKGLALSGFVIALAVLFLFLRELRAVAVVAVAVPVSLLAALALLFVGGQTLNLITLFGLAVGIGMLVDNSIVVYEAVQRRLERGVSADEAVTGGVRRTVRAITAASVTTAVVFVPLSFTTEDAVTRGMLELMAIAIVLPLGASLLVAVGLVPLLAHRLAAPAALARLEEVRARKRAYAGLVRPDRGRELFGGLLKVALRRPAGWLGGAATAVLLTAVVAVPWLTVSTMAEEATEADEVRMVVEVAGGGSLAATAEVFARLEQAAKDLNGVELVESYVQEEGGSLTIHLVDQGERPPDLSAARVREVVRDAARGLKGVDVRGMDATGGDESGGGNGGGSNPFGQGPAKVVLSGPDALQLGQLATAIEERLESIPEVKSAWTSADWGPQEIRVEPDSLALAGLGLTPDQVLPALAVVRREGIEMRTGFTLADGREIPLSVRSIAGESPRAGEEIESLRLATPAGVVPLGTVAEVRRMPAPPAILHHNGRRETTVFYRFGDRAPRTGPARRHLDEEVRDAVRDVHRPAGYAVEALGEEQSRSWFKRTLVPILLLLLAVLAITFESLVLPVVILISVPLTVLGAVWALVLAGMPADLMALVGAVALLGLTVNPAILLVDRMQQHARATEWSAGAAALVAVRERTRPVLMTTCTTIAGLWPLALTTGRENEIWPPFATVVMGGLATSTLLTLLLVPVGFVLLSRLERMFGRLGPWVVLGWAGGTTAVMVPLVWSDQITTTVWQVITTVLVGAALLGLAVLLAPRQPLPEPIAGEGPPAVEVRLLYKVYGRPGPVGRAWCAGERFAERVLARGGTPFVPRDARERASTLVLVLLGAGYLALNLEGMLWRLAFSFAAAVLAGRLLLELRRARGRCDAAGRVAPGGVEGVLAAAMPWLVLAVLGLRHTLLPRLAAERPALAPGAVAVLAVVVAVTQGGRRTAARIAVGELLERAPAGLLRRTRTLWRRFSRRVLGLDLPREEVVGLRGVSFRADHGMVGILGPNGAGKTTLLRVLAGIHTPSLGTATLGGVAIARIRRHLARWVGYLPQDFGLPGDLSARDYLSYYALLYDIGPREERKRRVEGLLEEVGLAERADERIASYSGGMRQRAAVARTLLRLPPVIIVDEPTVGLDPRERIRFRNLLARLASGRVVLFSTHVVEDVAVACERVIVLAGGEVVFDGQPAALAEVAQGRVWEARLAAGGETGLPQDAAIVDQVPEPEGGSRARILCGQRPVDGATVVEPTLEDGYLMLVGGARSDNPDDVAAEHGERRDRECSTSSGLSDLAPSEDAECD